MNQLQQQLSLAQTKGTFCENCGSGFFKQVVVLRSVSKLLAGTTEDLLQLVPVFRCDDCNELCKTYFPEGMTDLEARLGMNKVEQQSSLLMK